MTKIQRVQGRIREIWRAYSNAEPDVTNAVAKHFLRGLELEYLDLGCNSAKTEAVLRVIFKDANERFDRHAKMCGY